VGAGDEMLGWLTADRSAAQTRVACCNVGMLV